MIAASAVVSLGCYIHSFAMLDPAIERRYFHPLIQLLMFGVNLSFMTGDLFNLFVAFEIMLMASYALLTIGGSKKQMKQAYKYVLLNLVGSTIFVISAGLMYGMMGTLNMAHLAQLVAEHRAAGEALPPGFVAVALMLVFVFGLKGAMFPLWFWLPDTYYTVPISIGALFGGMLTKVGMYSLARTVPLFLAVGEHRPLVQGIIAVAAIFTMFLGVLGAVSKHNVRKILAIHVISQVGYMVFGIAVLTGISLAGCAFYMIQHMVVKSSLFLCCGMMEKYSGSDDLDRIGGLLKRDWLLATIFIIAAFSLVGLPPLSGFFGKIVIIQEGWAQGFWYLSLFGLATGLLTLLSMLKIWSYGFWSESQGEHVTTERGAPRIRSLKPAYFGAALLVVAALFLGFAAQPVYHIAFNAGRQLEDPSAYIRAVLGPDGVPPTMDENTPSPNDHTTDDEAHHARLNPLSTDDKRLARTDKEGGIAQP
jgi:multicomponent Na+:H+ antiporter subunit D